MFHACSDRWANTKPVHPQSVSASDPVLRVERQKFGQSFLLAKIERVALKLGDNERKTRHLGRKVVQLDSPEIGQRNFSAAVWFSPPLIDLRFDRAQFLVRNDEKVAGAARWVENPDLRQALAQVQQHSGIVASLLKLRLPV